MPKREDAGRCCPICLAVDDPAGMISVNIERTNPPDAVVVHFCTRCARAITAATIENDLPLLQKEKREHEPDATSENRLDSIGAESGITDRERLESSPDAAPATGAPGELGSGAEIPELDPKQGPGSRRSRGKNRDTDVTGE
jgi:hypothetical protein